MLLQAFFVHHFIATCKFHIELQYGNAHIGAKIVFTSETLTFDIWPRPFAWTSLLSMVITFENFMMILWQEHCEKGVTDGRTDRQTDRSVLRTAWSQLKTGILQHNSYSYPVTIFNLEFLSFITSFSWTGVCNHTHKSCQFEIPFGKWVNPRPAYN